MDLIEDGHQKLKQSSISSIIAMKYFKKLDIFGRKVELNFEGKTVYKSYFGALMTIVSVTMVLLASANAIIGYFDETIPIIS